MSENQTKLKNKVIKEFNQMFFFAGHINILNQDEMRYAVEFVRSEYFEQLNEITTTQLLQSDNSLIALSELVLEFKN